MVNLQKLTLTFILFYFLGNNCSRAWNGISCCQSNRDGTDAHGGYSRKRFWFQFE